MLSTMCGIGAPLFVGIWGVVRPILDRGSEVPVVLQLLEGCAFDLANIHVNIQSFQGVSPNLCGRIGSRITCSDICVECESVRNGALRQQLLGLVDVESDGVGIAVVRGGRRKNRLGWGRRALVGELGNALAV